MMILDEAQSTYSNTQLWYVVIKSVLGSSTGIRICLLSSYGSSSTGAGELRVHFALWTQVIRTSSTDRFNLCFPGIGRMSDWGLDIDGKIDFMVLDPGWGVELLRDGDRMELISHWYSQANERTPHSRLQTLAPANHL